jgi:hypothetical protein
MMEAALEIAPYILVNLLCMLWVVLNHAINGEEIRRRDMEEMEAYIERHSQNTSKE